MYLIYICMYVLSYMYLCIYFDFDIEIKELKSESGIWNNLDKQGNKSSFLMSISNNLYPDMGLS